MGTRLYVSEVRTAAAAEKRQRVLEAAGRLLREEGIAGFSLDSVAKAAGVTRLTVYNQFGSRRGLLEAVFDRIAEQGGLQRLNQVMANPDPRAAIDQLVDVFCAFWSSDPALARLHDAMVIDDEFGQALGERNERRRRNLTALVQRFLKESGLKKGAVEVVDLMFTLTSCTVFRMLSANRSRKAVSRMIKAACADALDRLANGARP